MNKPKRADDRRRHFHKVDVDQSSSESGRGHPLANLFNDRRKNQIGAGKRAS